jgi:hypothetical protein
MIKKDYRKLYNSSDPDEAWLVPKPKEPHEPNKDTVTPNEAYLTGTEAKGATPTEQRQRH